MVAVIDGAYTCTKLWQQGQHIRLQAANPDYEDIVPRYG